MPHHLVSSYLDLAELADYTGEIPVAGSVEEKMALRMCLASSRYVDHFTRRFFGQEVGNKVFNVRRSGQREFMVPDLAATPTVLKADVDRDGTFETDLIVSGVNFILTPDVPPYYLVEFTEEPSLARNSRLQIGNLWGWPRDMEVASTLSAGVDATTTTWPMTAAGAYSVGQVLLCESEMVLVEAKAALNLTVRRGINGSTAATHAISTPVPIIRHINDVRMGAGLIATRFYKRAKVSFADPNIANTFTGALTTIQPLVRLLLGQGLPKEVELILTPLKRITLRGG